ISEAAYPGGSGEDRITAIALMPNGNLAVAGVTSSSDLFAADGVQGSFAGGTSDGFIAQYSSDLQKVVSSAYLGGAGAEEPIALVTNPFNELLVGGWTNSSDFPLTDAIAVPCGNGPEYGF